MLLIACHSILPSISLGSQWGYFQQLVSHQKHKAITHCSIFWVNKVNLAFENVLNFHPKVKVDSPAKSVSIEKQNLEWF